VRAAIVLVLLTAPAWADGKLKELETGYDKEVTSCATHASGVAKVLAGAKELVAAAPDDALAADVDKLDKGHAAVQAYCDEVAATLVLLRADPKATYKSLERQLDEKDNKIRKLRAASKKALDELSPVISRTIPKINGRVSAPAEKKLPAKFPSGRAIELPKLAGTWALSGGKTSDVAEYTEGKATTTITVRVFTAATCEQQQKGFADKPYAAVGQIGQGAAAWYRYKMGGRAVLVKCTDAKDGGLLQTIESDASSPAGPFTAVAEQMLAAQTPKKP
jgi:hypothetical protein